MADPDPFAQPADEGPGPRTTVSWTGAGGAKDSTVTVWWEGGCRHVEITTGNQTLRLPLPALSRLFRVVGVLIDEP